MFYTEFYTEFFFIIVQVAYTYKLGRLFCYISTSKWRYTELVRPDRLADMTYQDLALWQLTLSGFRVLTIRHTTLTKCLHYRWTRQVYLFLINEVDHDTAEIVCRRLSALNIKSERTSASAAEFRRSSNVEWGQALDQSEPQIMYGKMWIRFLSVWLITSIARLIQEVLLLRLLPHPT